MRVCANRLPVCSVVSAVALFTAFTASAANGTWSGAQSAFWTNSANWSASPYPVGSDTALFAADGAGQANIDVAGLPYIKNIAFDMPSVGAFTLGTGAANSQTLVLADSGEIKLSATAANSKVFNCGIQLGTDRSGLALNVDVAGQLDPRLQHTILTCTGTRTGTFASKSLPFGWGASYEPNGDIRLLYAGGTVLQLK
jgi:hypothetical protein